MCVHAEPVGIVGQPGMGDLAMIRAPMFLPESVNGLLFETHWLYWVAGAALALILLHLGRSRRNGRLSGAGAVVLGVTVAWMLAAYVVDTAGERLYRAHADMAQAASVGDVERILSYFAPDFECDALAIQIPAEAHKEIAERLKSYGIKSNTITGYRTDIFGMHATTTLNVITQSDLLPEPVKTTWRLTWEDLPREDWRVEKAELLAMDGHSVSDAPLPHDLPGR